MKKPRFVVWITTDHLRADTIGALGNPAVHTPNIDRLVRGGVSFTNCFANSPLCMPSRCSFMTGCYPPQTGVMRNGHELPADFKPVVAQSFAEAGWHTVQIGKLHFQGHQDMDLDPRPRHAYGFNVFNLSEEPGCYEDAYKTWLRGAYPELVETFSVPRPLTAERKKEARDFRVLEAPWQASHSGWVAESFVQYLSSWGLPPEPHFFHLGFYAPHPPLNPTREMMEPYRSAAIPDPARRAGDPRDGGLDGDVLADFRRHFFAMITGVDLAVGRILQCLEDSGVLEETLIFFGSDHGDACGDHGQIGKSSAYFDGMMRVPWIVHWPQAIPAPGTRMDEMVEMVDVLPTLLELSGVARHPAMVGRSWAPAIRGEASPDGREDVFAIYDRGDLMVRTETMKYLRYPEECGDREALYDLETDSHEFCDVSQDPKYASELQAMRERALRRCVEACRSVHRRRTQF